MIVQQAASALGMQTDLMATHQCAKAVTLLNYLTPLHQQWVTDTLGVKNRFASQ